MFVRLVSSIISSFLLCFLVVYFSADNPYSLYSSYFFGLLYIIPIYTLIGTPVSLLLDFILENMKSIKKVHHVLVSILFYLLAGVIISFLFFVLFTRSLMVNINFLYIGSFASLLYFFYSKNNLEPYYT